MPSGRTRFRNKPKTSLFDFSSPEAEKAAETPGVTTSAASDDKECGFFDFGCKAQKAADKATSTALSFAAKAAIVVIIGTAGFFFIRSFARAKGAQLAGK